MANKNFKTIGLLGGMSAVATGEYYQRINQLVNQKMGGHHIAELIISSVNFALIETYIKESDWEGSAHYLAEKAQRLEAAGVSCVFLGTNTMHRVRETIKAHINVPFIDIFKTVARAIKQEGKSKVGILGTFPVMTDAFYVDAYRQEGIEIIALNAGQKKEIDRIIFEELTHHQLHQGSKAFYISTMYDLMRQGAEGIILGCTEIKMLVQSSDVPDIPLFDSLELHCALASAIAVGEIPPTVFD